MKKRTAARSYSRLLPKSSLLLMFCTVLAYWIGFLGMAIGDLRHREIPAPVTQRLEVRKETVLGAKTENPQFTIVTKNNQFYGGGLLTQSINEPPAIEIRSNNYSGSIKLDVYRADTEILTNYLSHDKDFKQIVSDIDVSKLSSLASKAVELINSANNNTKVDLPVEKPGIYLLRITVNDNVSDNILIRADKAVLLKRGDRDYIFWGQDLVTKRSINAGTVQTLNFLGGKKVLGTANFGSDGVAKLAFNENADAALVTAGDSVSLIPINLRYLNAGWNYASWKERSLSTKYFIFTDRPLYRPGDKIYFKSVIRNDDDSVYSIPKGNATVKIYKDWDEKQAFFTKVLQISADGTVYGEADLPQSISTGMYSLKVSLSKPNGEISYESNYTFFQVEFFRKPEYYLDVVMGNNENISGDKTSFKISGFYFAGQPLAGQTVNYKIYSSDYYENDYYSNQPENISGNYRYSYWGNNTPVKTGSGVLDSKGELEVALDTKIDLYKGKTQIYSVEATYDNGSGNPALSRKNILVYSGEYGIFRKDGSYGSKVNDRTNLEVKLVPWRRGKISGIPLTAKIVHSYWEKQAADDRKNPLYIEKTENLPDIAVVSDSAGKAIFSFTPQKAGTYKLNVEGTDSRGNIIIKSFYVWVIDYNYPLYDGQYNSGLTVKADREKYAEGSTAVLTINSEIPDRDVFISLERDYLRRYEIVHLYGKTGELRLPLTVTDIPNIFAGAHSFSDMLDRGSSDINIPPQSKQLKVSLAPDKKTYGPGEDILVNLSTTDTADNPIPAEMAVYAVDKAIFELTDGKPETIYDYFWSKRYNNTQTTSSYEGIFVEGLGGAGGCFTAGTKILMGDGTQKNIEDVKIGDKVRTRISENDAGLVPAVVTGTHSVTETGYLILNGDLKVTPRHLLFVNDIFKDAGSIQTGDYLRDKDNRKVVIRSIEWQEGKTNVYNLTIGKYQTYFAGGVWVHNQKGDGGASRSVFKDTAYWNPAVRTDASGRAQIRFKLPDNLTTWVIAGVASTADTRAGQSLSEVVVTKDVVLRPILPNIMRTGDKMVVSALLANYTENSLTFDAGLSFDGGAVEIATHSGVTVKAKESKQLSWSVLPLKDKEKGVLTFSAVSRENKDSYDKVVSTIPIYPFGFYETRAETGDSDKIYNIKPSSDADPEKSRVTLSLSSSLLGMMPSAISYLINYPYGCVEQTTSRFVPAVIARANQAVFASIIEGKDIDGMIAKGVARLKELQHPDGGWSWWSLGDSELFTTVYVTEYLMMAKDNGADVDNFLLESAKAFIERFQTDSNNQDGVILKNYALTVIKSTQPKFTMNFTPNVKADIYSLWVLTNILNGVTNPQDSGLNGLIALGKSQGDGIYWEAGEKLRFGSVDASTAMAIRALSLSGEHRNIVVKAIRFLLRNRKYEYFSSTFGTAQVVRALAEFAKTGSELSPNFTYSVTLDGKEVGGGSVTDSQTVIQDIVIPYSGFKSEGSNLSVSLKGEGQLYSTLQIKELHTDKNAKAENKGISIKRDYLTTKGDASTIAVGDEVTVRLIVGGLSVYENYGLIDDDLPAGLIPINEKLKNEQNSGSIPYYYDGSGREGKENGMLLSLYKVEAGERIYTYKARAVTEGIYSVSPATVALMYAPEIYGRSDAQTVTITGKSTLPELIKEYVTPTPLPVAKSNSFIAGLTGNKNLLALGFLFIPLVILIFIIAFRKMH